MSPVAGTIYWGRILLPFDGSADPVQHGAVYVPAESTRVHDMGSIDALRARHPGAAEIGGTNRLVMPGLIDAHQHGRAVTPAEQGCWDETLELWLLEQRAIDRPDPGLSARVAAMRSLLGGVTTIMHPHVTKAAERRLDEAHQVVEAYALTGARVTFGLDISDRASYSYDDDRVFLSRLPDDTRDEVERALPPAPPLAADDLDRELESLQTTAADTLIAIALAPRGPQWCSLPLLEWVAEESRRGVAVQIHCSETMAQYAWFLERNDSPVRFLHRHGLLSPATTLAHCVWLDDRDVAAIVETGAGVAHNPTSNLRLQSGRAPIGPLRAAGVTVGIGTDSVGIGRLPDLFTEIRLARWLENLDHGQGGRSPTAALHDALRGGAVAAGQADEVGVLREGSGADLVLLDWETLTARADADGIETDAATLVAERATRWHVTDVVVAGRQLVRDGRYLLEDQDELERALHEQVARLQPREAQRNAVTALRPHLLREVERLHRVAAGTRFAR